MSMQSFPYGRHFLPFASGSQITVNKQVAEECATESLAFPATTCLPFGKQQQMKDEKYFVMKGLEEYNK